MIILKCSDVTAQNPPYWSLCSTRASSVGDHFLFYCDHNVWFRGYIVTLRSQRYKLKWMIWGGFFFLVELLDEDDENCENHGSKDDHADSELSDYNSLLGLVYANSDDSDDDMDMDESCGLSDVASLPSLVSLSDSDTDSESDWKPDRDGDSFNNPDEHCCSGTTSLIIEMILNHVHGNDKLQKLDSIWEAKTNVGELRRIKVANVGKLKKIKEAIVGKLRKIWGWSLPSYVQKTWLTKFIN